MLVGVGLRKCWLECVNDDMRKFGLKKEMAHDRTVWRSAGFMGTQTAATRHGKCDVKRAIRN